MLCLGLIWLSAWSIAIGFGKTFIEVAVFRGLQGMGAAMTVPSAIGIISSYFVGPDRTRALSIYGASGAVGFCSGLIFGGFLSSSLGWKYIFRLVVIVTALLGIIGWLVLPKDRLEGQARAKLDYAGAAMSTAGLILLSFVLSSGGVYGWGKPFIIALLIVSCALLVIFTLLEKHVKNPIMPLSLWKISNFAGLWIAGFSMLPQLSQLFLSPVNQVLTVCSRLWKLPDCTLLPCPHGSGNRPTVCRPDSSPFLAHGGRWLHGILTLRPGRRGIQRQDSAPLGYGSIGAGAGSELSYCRKDGFVRPLPSFVCLFRGLADNRSWTNVLPTSLISVTGVSIAYITASTTMLAGVPVNVKSLCGGMVIPPSPYSFLLLE